MTEKKTANPTAATTKPAKAAGASSTTTTGKASGPAAKAARKEVTPIPKTKTVKAPAAKAPAAKAKPVSPAAKRRADIAKAKADLAAEKAAEAAANDAPAEPFTGTLTVEEAAAADCADAGLNAEATAEVAELAEPTDDEWEAPAVSPTAELTFTADNGGLRTVLASSVRAVRPGSMMPDPKAPRERIRGSIVFVERAVLKGKKKGEPASTTIVEVESSEPAESIRERLAGLGVVELPDRPAATPKAAKPAKAKAERAPRPERPEGARTRTPVAGRVKMSDEDALKRAKEIIAAAGGKTTRWKVIGQLRAEGNQVAWQPLFEAFDAAGLVPPGTRAAKGAK